MPFLAVHLRADACAYDVDVEEADETAVQPYLRVDVERSTPAEQVVDQLRLGRGGGAPLRVAYRSTGVRRTADRARVQQREQLVRVGPAVGDRAQHQAAHVP